MRLLHSKRFTGRPKVHASAAFAASLSLSIASAVAPAVPGAASNALPGKGDSTAIGNACRPVACAEWIIFEASEDAVARLFKLKQSYRTEELQGAPPTVSEIRTRLTRELAPNTDSLHLVGAFVMYSGGPERHSYVTGSGDGVACALRRLEGTTAVALYQVEAGKPTSVADELVLKPSDLLLARVRIAGSSCVVVVRSPFLDPANFDRESAAITERIRSGVKANSAPSRWLYLAAQQPETRPSDPTPVR